jgi:sec-independent protein translocase protein TatB
VFGVDTTELIIVAVLALLFIGPKDLPIAMRTVGRWVGKVRGMARHFNAGIEAVIREAELEEMEKKWREENERIMREFPAIDDQPVPELQSESAGEPMLPLGETPPPSPKRPRSPAKARKKTPAAKRELP